MKEVWLIRHAESQGNTSEFGGADPRLSKRGQDQAAQVKGSVDLVIISPMKRTLETYLLSQISCSKVIVSDLVREWMGGGKGEYRQGETPTKVETAQHLRKRADIAIEFLKAQPEQRIAVISHSGFLSTLTDRLFGTPMHFANAQIIHRQLG
jgi:broad specificity phosphatase PhoE